MHDKELPHLIAHGQTTDATRTERLAVDLSSATHAHFASRTPSSQALRAPDLRRTCSFGLSKTALFYLLTAAAITLIRLDAFLEGKTAAKTQVSLRLSLQGNQRFF